MSLAGLGAAAAPLIPIGVVLVAGLLATDVVRDVLPNPSGVYDRDRPCATVARSCGCCGHTDREAAVALNLSRHTVRDHKRRLFAKLGANTKAELMKLALRKGLAA